MADKAPFLSVCLNCLEGFEARRKTARFCGGTCRQRWNRRQRKTPGTPQNIDAEVRDAIEALYRMVETFTRKYKLSDLAGADTGPLEDALETLGDLFLCEYCGERKADGWDNIEYCKKCEIETFELLCWRCEKRKPSVKSDDQLCTRCERAG